ncbi:MAG: hypothetical protein H0Z40_11555 [Desulfotomaculum sp.]|nr:hypothetical protein [Desulfotomaculum sp.]
MEHYGQQGFQVAVDDAGAGYSRPGNEKYIGIISIQKILALYIMSISLVINSKD